MTETTSQQSARLIIVTGLSGSGKSVAIRQLEDSGYYCIDNLPAEFLVDVVPTLISHGQRLIAVSIDARSLLNLNDAARAIETLRASGMDVRVLFLCATTEELLQRFSETRRRHPLTLAHSGIGTDSLTLTEAIDRERSLLEGVTAYAHVIDTTRVSANTLRNWVKDFANCPSFSMMLTFESFGFKHGVPAVADLVFDVRNLPNPYYDKSLRPLTGLDQPIVDYFADYPIVNDMIQDIAGFIEKWLPSYLAQNRNYLTIAIGCTGGQHRSVFVSQTLANHFATKTLTLIRHRELINRGLIPADTSTAPNH